MVCIGYVRSRQNQQATGEGHLTHTQIFVLPYAGYPLTPNG